MLSCSARAVEAHWAFDAADTSTWAAATAGIDHVQAVGRHTEALLRAAAAAGEATTQRNPRGGGGSGGGGGGGGDDDDDDHHHHHQRRARCSLTSLYIS